MKIILTGSSSHLATVLLPQLCAHPQIKEVIGLDLKPGNFHHSKFIEYCIDVRDPTISSLFEGAFAVIHMAFVVLRSHLGKDRKNRKLIRDINIRGSKNVFTIANDLQLNTIIHLSSAVVYGAWAGNPMLIKESQQRKVMPGFCYAEDKNAVEDWLDKFEHQSRCRIVRLRPHAILGPHSQPFLLRMIRQPFYPYLANPQPLTQCIWEQDVAEAIIKSLFSNASGVFNLAAQPAISFKEIIASTHKLAIPLPFPMVKFLQQQLWRFSSLLEEPGWLEGMKYSLALDTSKAETVLAWQPSFDTYQCINQAMKLKNIK